MDFWMGFICGVCVMSALAFIGIEIFDHGKDYGALFCGPAMWVAVICAKIYGCITDFHKLNERGLVLCPDNEIRWIKFKDFDAFIEVAPGYDYVPMERRKSEDWDETLWYKCYPGNARYAPRSIWKRYERVDKAVVLKVRKEYKQCLKRCGND